MKTIEKDERLLPLPNTTDLHLAGQDIPTNYSPFYDEDFNEGRSLREYFLIIYKRLPLILALTILVTAAVAFYMYRQPSIYEASTTMIIEQPKPKPQENAGVNINFGYDGNYYNTQLRLLRNIDLMREVVIRLGLYKDPTLFNQSEKGFISSLTSAVSGNKSAENKENSLPTITDSSEDSTKTILTPEENQRVDSYAAYLIGSLNVEQVPNTNLVNIKVTGNNPELIPKVSDMVAKVFIQQDAERSNKGARDSLADLNKSINELKTNIAQEEQERLTQMQNQNLPLTQDTKGADINYQRLTALSSEFLAAEDDRRKVQAKYEAAVEASKKGEFYGDQDEKGYIPEARKNILTMQSDLQKRVDDIDKQIQEADTKRSQLLVRYTKEHPSVKEVDAQIDKLKQAKDKIQDDGSQKIEDEKNKLIKNAQKEVLTNLQAQYSAAQRREGQLKSAYFDAIGKSNQQGQAETRLTTLTNEIETSRSLLNKLVEQQKGRELLISSNPSDNLSISTYASKMGFLTGPQRNRNIFIAFFLSLGIGIGLAFLLDYLDDSIKNSDDIGKHLGLATLALIPHQSILDKKKRGAISSKNGSTSSTALIAIEDTRSAMAEAYRHLRTSLLFSSAGKPPQSILVTSSQPSEGKTTTAINTAITLAQSGADVVIIDCDLRRPRLHSHFGMDNTNGLTNYLSGEKNTANLLKSYPELPKLKVITSGPIPPNPTELLSSNEMKNLLQYLKGNFNHIIVDSPPAISFTDAAILSTLVDGVVLVAMSGKSSIHLIRRFKQRLNTIGARIYGVVLNGLRPDSFEYGYYGYGYSYSYDYDDDDSTPRMEEEPKAESAKN